MTMLTGTRRLARLVLRRDRVRLPLWLLGLAALLTVTASSVAGLYQTAEEQAAYARSNAASAVGRVFSGALAEVSQGGVVFTEVFVLLAVLTALMNVLAVVRHTRQNEETGRTELIGSAVVGRYAPLTAALLVVLVADAVLAALLAGGMAAAGLPATGSLATGIAIAAVGAVFAGVAAVTAQVSESARGANGLAAIVLGAAFLLRGAGDGLAGSDGTVLWPSWLSPIGWGQQVHPYAGERWWPLALHLVLLAVLVGSAFVLGDHRDVGTGMMPVRRGPATAARRLLSPLGLAWRLQRGVLYGWAAGLAVVSVALGAVGREAETLLRSSRELSQAFGRLGGGGDIVDVYFSAMMGLLGVVIAGCTVQALLRMRAEETTTLESVLATAVSRPRWMLGHITCAVLGTAAVLLVTGLGTALSYGVAAGTFGKTLELVVAPLVQLPAALALAGAVVAVLGALPRRAVALSWSALAACLLLAQIGPILELPQALMNLSPFTHVPEFPSADPAVLPLAVLPAVAAALAVPGVVLFRRRDIAL